MRCPSCQQITVVEHDSRGWIKKQFLCLSCQKTFSRAIYLRKKTFWLSFSVISFLSAPLILLLPMHLFLRLLPQPTTDQAKVAIILGRGPESQTELAMAASRMWSSNRDLSFFVSGMTDAPEIMRLLTEMGVPKIQVWGERCSQTTWENGLFSTVVLDSGKVDRVLLVTDSYHMPRAFLVFKSFDFKVQPYPIELEHNPLDLLANSKTALREYAALVSYGLGGKFYRQPLSQQLIVESEASQKLRNWGCQLN